VLNQPAADLQDHGISERLGVANLHHLRGGHDLASLGDNALLSRGGRAAA